MRCDRHMNAVIPAIIFISLRNSLLRIKNFIKWSVMLRKKNISVDFQKQGTFSQALLVPNLAHQQIGWQARQCLADELPVMYKDING